MIEIYIPESKHEGTFYLVILAQNNLLRYPIGKRDGVGRVVGSFSKFNIMWLAKPQSVDSRYQNDEINIQDNFVSIHKWGDDFVIYGNDRYQMSRQKCNKELLSILLGEIHKLEEKI